MRLERNKILQLVFVFIVALATALYVQSATASTRDHKVCAKVKRDIARVESRMRAGYTAKQGRRLEERLRRLRKKRYRVCR